MVVARLDVIEPSDVPTIAGSADVVVLQRELEPVMQALIADFGNEEMRSLGLATSFNVLDARVVGYLNEFSSFRISGINRTTQRAIATALAEGVLEGEGIGALSRRVRGVFDTASTTRAKQIARTEVNAAANFARQTAYAQSGVVQARRWLATRDTRVRDNHRRLDGQVQPIDEPFRIPGTNRTTMYPGGFGIAAEDINCFLPGTRVRGTFVGGVRSKYRGPAVEVETRGGSTLRVTSNHPVATPEGMVPAHALRDGAGLLRHVRDRKRVGDDVVEPDVDDGPPLIDEVFGALCQIAPTARAVLGPHDLHGDAEFADREVDVADAHGLLRHSVQAKLRQLGAEGSLAGEDVRDVSLSGAGSEELLLARMLSAARRVPGGTALPLDGLGIGLLDRPLQPLCFASAPELDAGLLHFAEEARAGNTDLVGELLRRLSGQVAPDEIVEVRHFDWSGHVYDLQSTTGMLWADSILTSNCRCTTVPVVERVNADTRESDRDTQRAFDLRVLRWEDEVEAASARAFREQERAVLRQLEARNRGG